MAKSIALRSAYNDAYFNVLRSGFSSQLKQQALLFDQIGFLHLERILNSYNKFKSAPNPFESKFETFLLELRWLQENGIIFETRTQDLFNEKSADIFLKPSTSQSISEFRELLDIYLNTKINKAENKDQMGDVAVALQKSDAIHLRLMSIIMEAVNKVTAVTTLSLNDYSLSVPNAVKNDVVQIVIGKLPLPSYETPWEQIIDYRNSVESKKNLLNLRRWINKISSEDLSPTEIEEELEWLINEFQTHMKLHKMKANMETLEVIIKTPLEIIENLVKFKFSKLPEPFFSLKKRQINLMEAELNAPGRELSYIIKTQEAFQPDE